MLPTLRKGWSEFFFQIRYPSLSANKIPFKSFTVNICEQLKMGLGMQQQRQLYLGWGIKVGRVSRGVARCAKCKIFLSENCN